VARAIERAGQASEDTFEGYRVATTACLDWLRQSKRESGVVRIVDPVALDEAPFIDDSNPESSLVRRDDVRLAIMTSLQALAPRQRAVLVLRDVLDRSTGETPLALGLSEGNVKVLLHRARASLEEAHRVGRCDAPVDRTIVERFAMALEARDIEAFTKLLASEVWGLVDDGLGRRRPNFGARAVGRRGRTPSSATAPPVRSGVSGSTARPRSSWSSEVSPFRPSISRRAMPLSSASASCSILRDLGVSDSAAARKNLGDYPQYIPQVTFFCVAVGVRSISLYWSDA
jgi:RNA polymerase sigma factor (sigma-70 family)